MESKAWFDMKYGCRVLTGLMLTAGLAAAPATAQEITGSLTLYGWVPWLDIKSTARASGRTASGSADPIDVLEALDFGFLAAGEVHYGRIGILQDFMYSDIGAGGTLTGPFATDIDVDSTLLISTTALSYQLVEEDGMLFEPFVGFRYVDFDTDVTATGGGPLGVARSVSVNEDWFDPIVGFRARMPISDRVSFGGFALIGGFGAGSEFTTDVYAGFEYTISERLSTNVGFRYLYIDYEANLADVQLEEYGPLIGLRIRF